MALATPVKIIFGFAQIIGQLDSVLQITLPETITSIIGVFKPLVANIWQSFLPVGCIASLDFYQRWISTVFIVPTTGLFAAYLWYAGRRFFCSSQKGAAMSKAEAVQQLNGNISLVIFFLYPNVSFSPSVAWQELHGLQDY